MWRYLTWILNEPTNELMFAQKIESLFDSKKKKIENLKLFDAETGKFSNKNHWKTLRFFWKKNRKQNMKWRKKLIFERITWKTLKKCSKLWCLFNQAWENILSKR
jgi:hypothetical protein